jgi:hypothetical protein
MKNFFNKFFNDPTVVSIIDTLIIMSILTAVCYGLHLLYNY